MVIFYLIVHIFTIISSPKLKKIKKSSYLIFLLKSMGDSPKSVTFSIGTKEGHFQKGPPPGPCKRAVSRVTEEVFGTHKGRYLNQSWNKSVSPWQRNSEKLTSFFRLHKFMIENNFLQIFKAMFPVDYTESPCKRVVLTSFWERVYARMTADPDDIRLRVVRVQAHVRGWRVRLLLSREKTWNLLLKEGL